MRFACHLQKLRVAKLLRYPISVGIDPEREFSPEFCGVGNMIEVAI